MSLLNVDRQLTRGKGGVGGGSGGEAEGTRRGREGWAGKAEGKGRFQLSGSYENWL